MVALDKGEGVASLLRQKLLNEGIVPNSVHVIFRPDHSGSSRHVLKPKPGLSSSSSEEQFDLYGQPNLREHESKRKGAKG